MVGEVIVRSALTAAFDQEQKYVNLLIDDLTRKMNSIIMPLDVKASVASTKLQRRQVFRLCTFNYLFSMIYVSLRGVPTCSEGVCVCFGSRGRVHVCYI